MDQNSPKNPKLLISLKDTAQILAVSIDELLQWNHHNILKPTISTDGEVGYTREQIDHFLIIRKAAQSAPTLQDAQVHSISAPSNLSNDALHWPSSNMSNQLQQNTPAGNTSQSGSSVSSIPLPIQILFFVSLFVGITAALFPAPEILTSKHQLSGQTIAVIPQASKDSSSTQNLNNVGESIFNNKLSAPALYADKKLAQVEGSSAAEQTMLAANQSIEEDNFASNDYKNELPPADAGAGLLGLAASSFSDPDDCGDCWPENNNAIDESGNIIGEAREDNLTVVVGRIDEMLKNKVINRHSLPEGLVNADLASQLIILSFGAIFLLFIFHKQLAYSIKRAPISSDTYKNSLPRTDFISKKALEVIQKTDGTVAIRFLGNEYKVSKPEMNSESDQFIEKLMTLTQYDKKEIEFDILRSDELNFATPLSRLVTRLGFVGLKRDLFFPRTSKSGVLFRKYLTQEDLIAMNITAEQLLTDLENRPQSYSNA